MVHILLQSGLENFEHYFTRVWDECNCVVVWAFFGIAFLWDWNENWPFPVLWPLPSFPNLLAYWVQHFHSIILQIPLNIKKKKDEVSLFKLRIQILRNNKFLNTVLCSRDKTLLTWEQKYRHHLVQYLCILERKKKKISLKWSDMSKDRTKELGVEFWSFDSSSRGFLLSHWLQHTSMQISTEMIRYLIWRY